jgi:DNA mismatch repair protein MutS
MRQFLALKEQHPDGILFFRCGDFYEMFFEDAVIAAEALDLTLTSRDKGKKDAVPMAGVPHHAARQYIQRLTEQGHKVALCEQTEDPKLAKGLVKRAVVRVITPGVVVDEEALEPKAARYFAAVHCIEDRVGLAYADVSTGEFRATELGDTEALLGELARVQPREVLATAPELDGPLDILRRRLSTLTFTAVDPCEDVDAVLEESLAGDSQSLGLADRPAAAKAVAQALVYARYTQPAATLPLTRLQLYDAGEAVVLDEAAIANLELTHTLIGGKRAGSLLAVIDKTRTAPGGRLLRRWLLYPRTDVASIRRRHDSVEFLVDEAARRHDVREALRHIADTERIGGRIALGVVTPRDLGLLRDSLSSLPELVELLSQGLKRGRGSSFELPELLNADADLLRRLEVVRGRLAESLVDEPPPVTKDGGYIRDGYCKEVDECRRLADGGKDSILAIEQRERKRTGISTLKVKYNRVFGYYIEVTKTNLARVPEDYVRKQTIATAERFVTTELAELESKIVQAQERLLRREAELLAELCAELLPSVDDFMTAGRFVATIDACAGLAEVAQLRGYVRPTVDDSESFEIVEGRHPVVETAVAAGTFVPNDCSLDTEDKQIVLLAQMGSFVPARSARVGIVDRIFTRVGAADNLARGESTFMVEMRETSSILSGASRKSLVVLDEVGRGTSTFDGVSIAWAVTEFLHDAIGCRTLFATHYHELCELAERRDRVHNYSVAAREHAGSVVFLHQVVEGGANRSYGIDVARLAGLPPSVVSRAKQILSALEVDSRVGQGAQLGLFSANRTAGERVPESHPVLQRLAAVDANHLTPMQALSLLAELQEQVDAEA